METNCQEREEKESTFDFSMDVIFSNEEFDQAISLDQ